MLFQVFVLMFLCVHSFALIGGSDDEKERTTHSAFLKGPPLTEDQWLDLPPEMWMTVFKNIDLKDAISLILVSRTFNAFDRDPTFWTMFAAPHQIEEVRKESENAAQFLKKAAIESVCETYFTFYSCFDAEIRLTVRYLYREQKPALDNVLDICLKSRQKIALKGMDFPRAHFHEGIKGIVSISRTDILNQSGEVFKLVASPYLGTLCDRKSELNFLPLTEEFCDGQRTFLLDTVSNRLRISYY